MNPCANILLILYALCIFDPVNPSKDLPTRFGRQGGGRGRDQGGGSHASKVKLAEEGEDETLSLSIPENPYCRKNLTYPSNKLEVFGEVLKKHVQALRKTPNGKVELVFLVDSSLSVGPEEFQNELKFVKKLLSDFTVDRHTTRVSVITFSSSSRVVRNIDHLTNPSDDKHKCSLIEEELPKIEYTGGGTYTIGAVREARKVFKEARPDAKKALFLITDGYSNGGDPRPVMEDLKVREGVEVFTFGIRQGNFEELCDMASAEKEEHTYILDSFEEFEALARRALHEDLHLGNYIVQSMSKCDSLCKSGKNCCDVLSTCQCGTHTGKYECVCKAGYYGSGLQGGCQPCPEGTYKNFTGPGDRTSCTSCPDPHQVTPVGSESIQDCKCKTGFQPTGNQSCSEVTCPNMTLPEHGHFVQGQCSNNVNAACGIRCKVGYKLQGSSLRLCTENGTWSGTDSICEVKRCPDQRAPPNGNMACTTADFSFGTTCRFSCNPGYKLVGSKSQSCLNIEDWSGIPPSCREVRCPKLPDLSDGLILPESCSVRDSQFGSMCSYICKEGYQLSGPSTKQCLETGRWSPDYGRDPVCIDITPPSIQCPGNIIMDTLRDESLGAAWWDQPLVQDNSLHVVSVTVRPALLPPVSLPIGDNVIVYTASDMYLNSANCSFTVTVRDIQAPRIDKCISPPPFIRRNEDVKVFWDEPIFSDNSLLPVKITQSLKPGLFGVGRTLVNYTATDTSGNNSTCVIEIIVQEHACSNKHTPKNGRLLCKDTTSGVECTALCKTGYDFAIKPSDKYHCDYDTGIWTPANSWPVKDCSASEKSVSVQQSAELRFKLSSECYIRSELRDLQQNLEDKIKQKVAQYCDPDIECSLDRFDLTCANEEEEEEDDGMENIRISRRRRQAEGGEETGGGGRFGLTFERDDLPNTEAVSTLSASYDIKGTQNSSTEFSKDVVSGVRYILNQIIKDARNGEFDSVISDSRQRAPFNTEVVDVEHGMSNATALCPPGSVPVELNCVRCPAGTFFNIMREECQGCERGTYQPEEGGQTCFVCPNFTSTVSNNSKSIAQCKGQCLPGSFSSDGLEWCETCPRGFYQPFYSQKNCLPCPQGTVTWQRGARIPGECQSPCAPGYVSRTGLQPCLPCLRGYFQPDEGKTSCFVCPEGATTRERASTSLEECEGVNGGHAALSSTVRTEVEISECFTEPCKNGGSCVSQRAGYTCSCLPGWTGINCEVDIDECSSSPCSNNATCQDLLDSFTCQCQPGWTGILCENDVEECLSQPCYNNATCIDQLNAFVCECPPGFIGIQCEIDEDNCSPSLCHNGARCVDGIDWFRCECLEGFTGDSCDLNIDECFSSPCLNNATCVDLVNAYRCDCSAGFSGLQCDVNIDECESAPCLHGGTCLDLENQYRCRCPPSYGGTNCQNKLNSTFDLVFQSSGITDYVILERPFGDRNISDVTMTVWVKTGDKDNQGTILSYATSTHENAFVLTDPNGFVLYINDKGSVTDVVTIDDRWHHLAVTWSSEGGAWKIYKDGIEEDSGSGLMTNNVLDCDGVLVIGQEQDKRGGKFSSQESFVGRLSGLNIWRRVLSDNEIKLMSHSCEEHIGDVIAWSDVIEGIKGRLNVEEMSICTGCSEPETPNHGSVSWLDRKLYSTAEYSCDEGYQLIGINNRTCNLNTEWTGTVPTCQKLNCGYPVPIEHGEPVEIDYSYNSTVYYQCDNGYRLNETFSIYCNSSGLWEGPWPTCREIICTLPLLPSHLKPKPAKIHFRLGDPVRFTCEPDSYRLNGSKVLRCLQNESWDSLLPFCSPILCPFPPNISHGFYQLQSLNHQNYARDFLRSNNVGGREIGFINGSDDSMYLSGRTIRYECERGYRLEGRETMTCQNNEEWSHSPPSCIEITCNEPISIENGYFKSISNIEITSTDTSSSKAHTFLFNADNSRSEKKEATNKTSTTLVQPLSAVRLNFQLDSDKKTPIYKYENRVQYFCNIGYILENENDIATCLQNGSWSHSDFKCLPVQCQLPSLPPHLNSDNTGTFSISAKAEFSCDEGHVLIGHSSTQCQLDGNWSNDIPSCELTLCPHPTNILNGYFMEISNYTFNNTLTYVCDDGYRLIGDGDRLCNSTGDWFPAELPRCLPVNCLIPENISNAWVNHTLYFGEILKIECNTGFVLESNREVVCLSNGSLSNTIPKCIPVVCPNAQEIENGSLSYSSDFPAVRSTVTYTCNEGFELTGDSTRSCLTDGSWSGEIPHCALITCAYPESIPNGNVNANSTTIGSNAIYRCNSKYELMGQSIRVCLKNKSWSGLEPSCKLILCEDHSPIEHGRYSGFSNAVGSSVTYKCDRGYTLVGSVERKCLENKTWSGSAPECNPIQCDPITNDTIANGYVLTGNYSFGSFQTFVCNSGYTLKGSSKLKCQATGEWNDSVPTCVEIECPNLNKGPHLNVTNSGNKFNSTVVYSCAVGYILEGAKIRICLENGTWSELEPKCIPVQCENPSNILNGEAIYNGVNYGDQASYKCHAGYQLNGTRHRECLASGEWSENEPECIKNFCKISSKPVNGHPMSEDVEAGDIVEYQCDQGYNLVNPGQQVCTSDGDLQGKTPSCRKVICPKPPSISNGNLKAVDTKLGDTAVYSCHEGYVLIGEERLVCESSGNWSSVPPACIHITCSVPEFIPYVIINSGGYTYGSKIEYSCMNGYTALSGDTERVCQANKTWSGQALVCEKNACPPPFIHYGFIAVSAGDKSIEKHVNEIDRFVFGISLDFDCEEGYRINGTRNLTCYENGTWSSPLPTCDPVKCHDLNISNAVIKASRGFVFGYHVIILCEPGLDLIGSSDIHCLSNGSWSNSIPYCKPVTCSKPNLSTGLLIVNEFKNATEYIYRSKIHFSCVEGYQVFGAQEIECLSNRKWSADTPVCVAVMCTLPAMNQQNSPIIYPSPKDIYRYRETIKFKCPNGRELNGSAEIQCSGNGNWSDTFPQCIEIQCSHPNISNAVFDPEETYSTVGSVLQVSCVDGYQLNGTSEITCTPNKTWSDRFPKCEIITCEPLIIENGRLSETSNKPGYIPGSNVSVICNVGYRLNEEDENITCLQSGNWSQENIECIPITCENIQIPNGDTSLKSEIESTIVLDYGRLPSAPDYDSYDSPVTVYKPGDVIAVQCRTGYRLVANNSDPLMCNKDGNWTGTVPTCELITCLNPNINHGRAQSFDDADNNVSVYPFGSLIEFICDDGFRLDGNSSEALCQLDGTWSEEFPRCISEYCIALNISNSIINGLDKYKYDSVMKVKCKPDYELFGDSELRCRSDGKFDGLMPLCLKIGCRVPEISHARFSQPQTSFVLSFQYDQEILVDCIDGYIRNGSSSIRCAQNKTWIPSLPKCSPVFCARPKLNVTNLKFIIFIQNNSYTSLNSVPELKYETKINFTCATGYQINGTDTMKCLSNGSWSSTVPHCSIALCAAPYLENGHFKPDQPPSYYTYGKSIRFRCNPGYKFSGIGETEMFCQPNGIWTAQFPTCIKDNCEVIPLLTNGSIVNGNSTLFDSKVTYTCNVGYEIVRNDTITCLSSLKWSEMPICRMVTCINPVRIVDGEFTSTGRNFNDTVKYTCREGYEIVGKYFLKCLSNGSWSYPFPQCRKIVCVNVPIIPHTDFVGESNEYKSTQKLRCHEGYVLKGSDTIECLGNRSWSFLRGECEIVKCNKIPPAIPMSEIIHPIVNTYNTTLLYRCFEGYQMRGIGRTKCMANGTWSHIQAECNKVQCANPDLIVNGSLNFEGNVITTTWELDLHKPRGFYFGDSINYRCDKGFELVGVEYQVCTSGGTWNGTRTYCEIVTCPSPPILFHSQYSGLVSGRAYSYLQEIAVECNEGFRQLGNGKIKCLADKTWNVSGVICDRIICPVPSNIPYGFIEGSSYIYGSSISYNCIEGYVLTGNKRMKCVGNGTWDFGHALPVCSPITCPYLVSINNGAISGNNFTFSSAVTYTCNTGYDLIGSRKRTCLGNGSWSEEEPSCRIRSCGEPTALRRVIVTRNSTDFNGVAEFRCEEGYELVTGDKISRCGSDGRWTGVPPTCRIISCPYPPRIDNGQRYGEKFDYNDKIRYECKQYFVLIGSAELTCRADGTWSSRPPDCVEKRCRAPPASDHLKYSGESFSAGGVLQIQCDEGYQLTGVNSLKCVNGDSWDGSFPSCNPITCTSPPELENGMIERAGPYIYGDILKYTCNSGYRIRGYATIRCQLTGKWSKTNAFCEHMICQEPPQIEHSSIVLLGKTAGDFAYYVCEEGYNLNGNNLIQCTSDLVWAGPFPTCEISYCGVVAVIDHGYTTVFGTTYGSKARYDCNTGYKLQGSSTVTCLTSGSWSYAEEPHCVPVTCPSEISNLPEHLSVQINQTTYHSNATLYCQEGFKLRGNSRIICEEHGNWTKVEASCEPVECPARKFLENGRIEGKSFLYNSEIGYSCLEGYRLEGSGSSVCLLNASWSSNPPICKLIRCESPEVPEQGFVNVTGLFYGARALFWCTTGYTLIGSDTLVCTNESRWSDSVPMCRLVGANCGRPQVNDSEMVLLGRSYNVGDRLAYMCRGGFTPISTSPPVCHANGTWSPFPGCNATCKFPCQNGGSCVKTNICKCPSGFGGRFCEKASCLLPCLNGGQCIGPYTCSCPPGYSGARCETPICKRPCENGGYCYKANRCLCQHGFLPPFCEKSLRKSTLSER